MALFNGTNIFQTAMVRDVSGNNAPPGSWFDALNLLFKKSLSQQSFEAQTLLGNVPQINEDISGLGWDIIDAFYDDKEGYIYYLLRGPGINSIYRWKQDVHQLVLSHPVLRFLSKRQLKTSFVLNGLLFWSEGVFDSWDHDADGFPQFSPPRCINVQKAILYTVSGGLDPDGYTDMDFQTIEALKYPPKFAPTVGYFTDPAYKLNFLNRKLLQFAYRYGYDNGERSLFSQFSRLARPTNNELMDGKRFGDIVRDNGINIEVNTGHHTVKFLELMYREGNTGAWYLFKKIDKKTEGLGDNQQYVYQFRGTEGYQSIGAGDLENYDFIPDVAGEQDYLHNNTIGYGRIQEGLEKTDVEVNYDLLYNRINKGIIQGYIPTIQDVGSIGPNASCIIIFPISGYVVIPVGDTITIKCKLLSDPTNVNSSTTIVNFSYIIPAGVQNGATPADQLFSLITAMAAYFNGLYPMYAWNVFTTLVPVPGVVLEIGNHIPYSWVNGDGAVNYNIPIVTQAVKFSSFKQGCEIDLGIMFYHRGNKDRGVASDQPTVFNPWISVTPPAGFANDMAYFVQIALNISASTICPNWATHWGVAMRPRSNIGAFMQRSVIYVSNQNGRTLLSLERFYEETFRGASYNYDLEVGDSIVLKYNLNTALTDYLIPALHLELTVMQILPTGGVGGGIGVEVELFDFNSFGVKAGSVFEFRKLKKSSDSSPYFALSKEYEIENPGTPSRTMRGEAGTLDITRLVTGTSTVYLDDNKTFLDGRPVILAGTDNSDGLHLVTSAIYDPANYRTELVVAPALGAETEFPSGATLEFGLHQQGILGATAILDRGDVNVRKRTMGKGQDQALNYMIETDSFSDYYDSRDYDKGRVYIYAPDATRQLRDNAIRCSLAYLASPDPELSYNQLNRFYAGNIQEVKLMYGPITMMESRGSLLRVGQLRKVSSIGIDRNTVTNPDGTNQYVLTNRTLGTVDPSENEFGVYRHEASIKIGSEIYFWDVVGGHIVKDTTGGSFSVNKKMNLFWQNISKVISSSAYADDIKIRFGYNPTTNEIYISAYGIGEGLDFTIGLDIESDEWTSFYSFLPDVYVNSDSRLMTFERSLGQMWEHNVGFPLNFYGLEYNYRLTFYINEKKTVNKILMYMFAAMSTQPAEVTVECLPDSTYPSGQKTYCLIDREENGFTFSVQNNIYTEGKPNQNVALVDGSPMRNTYFKVTIEGSQGQEAVINFVQSFFNS